MSLRFTYFCRTCNWVLYTISSEVTRLVKINIVAIRELLHLHWQACSLPMLTVSRLVVSGARRAVVVAGLRHAVHAIRRTTAVRGIQSIAQTDRVRHFTFQRLTFSLIFLVRIPLPVYCILSGPSERLNAIFGFFHRLRILRSRQNSLLSKLVVQCYLSLMSWL